jgi:hypothetical protein
MSDDEDVPFMNYRVWECDICKKVIELQTYEHQVVPERCSHCGETNKLHVFITGGQKGCLLIWNEKGVYEDDKA